MFIGHYGVALAAKKAEKNISLGLLFIAVQFVDILFCIFVLLGIEIVTISPGITETNPLEFVHYPFTHSLAASFVWAILVYLGFRFIPRKGNLNKNSVALIMGMAVLSHFFLDLITHIPDLPVLGSDSLKMGFGLWNYLAASYLVEAGVFLGGLWMYLKTTKGTSFGGKYGMILFAIALLIMNLINFLGPPPPNVQMLAFVGLANYMALSAIAFWLDKKRI